MDLVVALNTVNLTSAAGFLVARLAGCEVSRRGRYFQATGYRWAVPPAAAFTVGSVVISRRRLPAAVWAHEETHVCQYAVLGPAFLPGYLLACGWSWVRTGDWWSRNVFERRAGLVAGGYREKPLRRSWMRSPNGVTAAGAATA